MNTSKEATVKTDNELIAEFMGVSYDKTEPVMKVWLEEHDSILFYCEWHPEYGRGTNRVAWEFAPQRNWCQLMPVVEKIHQVPYIEFSGQGNYVSKIAGRLCAVDIVGAHKAVVEFIKFYNSQKQ